MSLEVHCNTCGKTIEPKAVTVYGLAIQEPITIVRQMNGQQVRWDFHQGCEAAGYSVIGKDIVDGYKALEREHLKALGDQAKKSLEERKKERIEVVSTSGARRSAGGRK